MHLETIDEPALFFAPFVSSTMAVEPGWIDVNGHLNVAYYLVLFDRAVDEAFGLCGLNPAYVDQRGANTFVVETRTRYRREITLRDPIRVTLQLIGFDSKRAHYWMEIRHATDGWLSATCEQLALHVDLRTRKASDFPSDILTNLAFLKAAHRLLGMPDGLGEGVRGLG